MLLILAAIILAFAMSVVLFRIGGEGYQTRHAVAGVAGIVLGLSSAIAALAYLLLAFNWIAAEHQAQIINREYGTNYTREEVFYAKNVIETVRNLERKRYEINGDLLRGKDQPAR